MIHEVGNIELCELLDMEPKAQCNVCLSYWDVGIVHCTCGHFLGNGTEENKKFVQYTMDPLSVPNYYIKKGQCKKKFYLGIHDRFIRDEKFRKNMFDAARTVEICRELANEDHTHHLTPEEIRGYRAKLVDSKQSRFRYDASQASTWLQASIVNLATAQRQRRCSSSQSKMDAKLFFVLVELVSIMVAFFLWESPRRRTQHRLIRTTW